MDIRNGVTAIEFNETAWRLCRERGGVAYRHYMEVGEFVATAKKRGINAHSRRLPQDEPGGMEVLEQQGLLLPVLRVRHRPITASDFRDHPEYFEIPKPGDYRPWNELKDEEGLPWRLCYHHLQLHALKVALSDPPFAVNPDQVLQWDYVALDRFKASWGPHANAHRELIEKTIERWYGIALILLAVQDRYLPAVTGSAESHRLPPNGGTWRGWSGPIDPLKAIHSLGVSLEDVQDARNKLSLFGRQVDPMRDWRHLMRLVTPQARDRLEGPVRLAQDYYDMTEVLRHCLEELTDEPQIPTPDMHDGGWPSMQESIYGKPIMSGDRKVLTRYLHRYGLVLQPRVALLTEGATEVAFYDAMLDEFSVDLERSGVWHHCLDGAQRAGNDSFGRLLAHLKWEGCAVHLLLDNDQQVTSHIERLVRKGLLVRRFCAIWQTQFEAEFGQAMLGKAIIQVLRQSPRLTHLSEAERSQAIREVESAVPAGEPSAGLDPFKSALAPLHICLDDFKKEIGKALAAFAATAIREQATAVSDIRPIAELRRVLNNAQAGWHDWSGFPGDLPPYFRQQRTQGEQLDG